MAVFTWGDKHTLRAGGSLLVEGVSADSHDHGLLTWTAPAIHHPDGPSRTTIRFIGLFTGVYFAGRMEIASKLTSITARA